MTIWDQVSQQVSTVTGQPFTIFNKRSVRGGSINSAYVLEGESVNYFVKSNVAKKIDMFDAEAQGLREIANAGVIRIPTPICWDVADESAYLVLEYIALGASSKASFEELGRCMANMHKVIHPQYGWHRENTIGFTPQKNIFSDDWISFWREHRLGYQLNLVIRNGYNGNFRTKLEKLMRDLPKLLNGYKPVASLLHGDLWAGNYAVDAKASPVIFDPAVYYGDREADIAMTELFGGFPPQFYAAYNEAYPLSDGYRVRKTLYNLYHVLNHLNLFGSGYLAQAEHMTDMLLSEINNQF